MHKTLIVALREYNAAVRTRTFVIGLLMLPLLMGGSFLVQRLLGQYRDTRGRRIAVVDRTPGAVLLASLTRAIERYNDQTTIDVKTGAQIRPRFQIIEHPAPPDTAEAADEMRLELSERVRRNELDGFLEIGPEAVSIAEKPSPGRAGIRYQSNRVTEREFPDLARRILEERVRQERTRALALPGRQVEIAARPVAVEMKGLSTRDARTGKVEDADEKSRMAPLFAPMIVMMLMFMLVLMTATPLMQGVVEEKMQRIAEVLLGSVEPFQLMLGKLLGMTAVSLTIAAVYLGGAYWAAHRWGVAEYATPQLIAWFFLYQTLAALMYGSLFIAVGAACTDMRETQNLLWPVMLVASLPMFAVGNVIREPNSFLVTVLSFFPFATPTLMIGRQTMPPGVPWWQPVVASVGVLVTTLLCVWAAGRIFRIGILLQGKGASPAEIARWVLRG